MVDQLLDGLPCFGGQAGGFGVSHGVGGLGELVGAPDQGAGIAAYISTIGNLIEKKAKLDGSLIDHDQRPFPNCRP